ncbi:CHASE domain-containing protein [Hoeflea sp. YIM 152468]|uniref:CHASE domain-containing protein n=1 Tax=Hoeflea sp. YIM 152468 TaxID=3031759 RepID=UPI0023DB0646|nr:CHASE domain-containing protein [Hoeflea sp. YIM 152468]MDF1606923.1 CHASE domain-containing protein [Hoeflea sp. YIM 152468]
MIRSFLRRIGKFLNRIAARPHDKILALFYRVQPALVFFVVALLGMLTAIASWYTIDHANRLAFVSIAEDAVRRVGDRVENHMLLVKSVEAHFQAAGEVPSAEAFKVFVSHLRKTEQFSGVQGIGFARYVTTGASSDQAIAAELQRNYGINRKPWPETSEEQRTPIVLLEPATDANMRALGFDMYSQPIRRAAILAALAERQLRASGMVQLVQENPQNPQAGYLMYTPYYAANSGRALGLVYAPFQIPSVFESALNRSPILPIHVTAWDGEPSDTSLIYRSDGRPSDRINRPQPVVMSLEVAGRSWKVEIRPSESYSPAVDQTRTFMLALGGLLLAGALAVSSRSQQRTIEVGEALREQSERALNDRELLLQEMKHRIKNMIARVLAMSRQTARSSTSLDDFTQSFNARLQAMASSQDLLARTAWQSADLRTLLMQELRQLFGGTLDEAALEGPDIELNEVAAQAFGLAFHELATNALKYGSAQSDTGTLEIRWQAEPSSTSPQTLIFSWRERSEQPLGEKDSAALARKGGFGTKLLDATMRVELGGSLDIVPDSHGIDVIIRVPYGRVVTDRQLRRRVKGA